MVQLCPGKAGFELAAGHDDGFDLRLAQAGFVVIGLEERARAAARHLSSCKSRECNAALMASVDEPEGGELCRFFGSPGQPLPFAKLLAIEAVGAALSKAIHRTASDRQPKSDPIPRTRNRWRSR